jgi:hypothetical protein
MGYTSHDSIQRIGIGHSRQSIRLLDSGPGQNVVVQRFAVHRPAPEISGQINKRLSRSVQHSDLMTLSK